MILIKRFDNFITSDTDFSVFQNILDMLNDIGVDLELKNFEIHIAKKDHDVQLEK